MDYRMEKPGMELQPSLLGYGCMRFPVNKDHTVDEEKAQQLIDRAMEAGVTYYDTAWFYHDGESEPMMGRLLSRYPRESYCLATKMPCAIIDSLEQAKDIFAIGRASSGGSAFRSTMSTRPLRKSSGPETGISVRSSSTTWTRTSRRACGATTWPWSWGSLWSSWSR